MKPRFFLFILFFSLLHQIPAQQNDALLHGSWLLTHTQTGTNRVMREVGSYQVISFYEDHTYQVRQLYQYEPSKTELSDSYFTFGQWQYDRDSIRYLTAKLIIFPEDSIRPGPVQALRVQKLTKDSLVLLHGAGDVRKNFHQYFTRVPLIAKRPELPGDTTKYTWAPPAELVQLRALPQALRDPAISFMLVNVRKPRKTVKVDGEFSVYPYEQVTTSGTTINMDYQGYAHSVSNAEIKMQLNWKNVESSNYFVNTTQTYDYSGDSLVFATTAFEDIENIVYHTPGQLTVRGFGGFFMGAGIFTAGVLAPLVSIEKNGFNAKRYGLWAAAGGLSAGLSIPLLIIGRERSYYIQNRRQSAKLNQQWQIQSIR